MVSRTGMRPLRHALRERLPFEQFHREVQRAVDFADVEHLAHVWMADRRRAARLAPETPPGDVVEPVRANRLDRDPALQALVERLVDDAHAALTQAAEDSKVGEAIRDHRWSTVYVL